MLVSMQMQGIQIRKNEKRGLISWFDFRLYILRYITHNTSFEPKDIFINMFPTS